MYKLIKFEKTENQTISSSDVLIYARSGVGKISVLLEFAYNYINLIKTLNQALMIDFILLPSNTICIHISNEYWTWAVCLLFYLKVDWTLSIYKDSVACVWMLQSAGVCCMHNTKVLQTANVWFWVSPNSSQKHFMIFKEDWQGHFINTLEQKQTQQGFKIYYL